MSGEDERRSRGSARVPSSEKRGEIELVDVEVTEEDNAAGAPFAVIEDDGVSPVPREEALTIGEIVDGAKDLIEDVSVRARRLVDRGRYRKLRISRKGKQVLPDIPLAAVAAIEAASMYGAGIARVLAVNVGAKFLFDVEVINEADKHFEKGKEFLLDGDLDRAMEAFERAVRIDDTHAGAFLQLGVLFRLRGDPARARPMLERALLLDEVGEVGRRAGEILRALDAEGVE